MDRRVELGLLAAGDLRGKLLAEGLQVATHRVQLLGKLLLVLLAVLVLVCHCLCLARFTTGGRPGKILLDGGAVGRRGHSLGTAARGLLVFVVLLRRLASGGRRGWQVLTRETFFVPFLRGGNFRDISPGRRECRRESVLSGSRTSLRTCSPPLRQTRRGLRAGGVERVLLLHGGENVSQFGTDVEVAGFRPVAFLSDISQFLHDAFLRAFKDSGCSADFFQFVVNVDALPRAKVLTRNGLIHQ
mmetsp:Transcript_9068/g.22208  ORF Transcript_9068/g.22208 Transcript_9068/m.22208 type:complete len:244 (-) Transcript_9068:1032-1763(-)